MSGSNAGQAYSTFKKYAAEHQLTVLHNDGLYRHLRMAKPGTRIWSWDIITWPGTIAIRGDIGDGYMFSRLEDMFDFMHGNEAPNIDFRYWHEKLNVGSRSGRVFSREVFLDSLKTMLAEREIPDAESIYQSAEDSVTAHEDTAFYWLDSQDLPDSYDINMHDWDFQFLLACYAIDLAVTEWKKRNG